MRLRNLVLPAAIAGILAPLPFFGAARADGVATRPDVIAVADIKPGMKGYGLTVFQGYRPERFDVEVIDVLPNFRPKQDLILIRTRHPRLDVTKIVAGMSGSPIYLDGKMAGAYAYGWTFGTEPVAGVTPIRNMLDDLARPLPDSIDGWPLRPLPARAARAGAGDPRELGIRVGALTLHDDERRHEREVFLAANAVRNQREMQRGA
ncbi:MAG TPA: SpoIVB peptidase S55 domain-containing protein, partial [Polyangiaceae bacterium]|nr:SpoIVB peptidase S55 domain-containing protein [Polyangiaceae bacterium]